MQQWQLLLKFLLVIYTRSSGNEKKISTATWKKLIWSVEHLSLGLHCVGWESLKCVKSCCVSTLVLTVGVMFNFPDQATVKKVVNCLPRVGIGTIFGLPQTRYLQTELILSVRSKSFYFHQSSPHGLKHLHLLVYRTL